MNQDPPELAILKRIANVTEADGPEVSIEALRERGWRYFDFPRMAASHWDYIKTGLGSQGADYHVLAEATYPDGSARGQLMFSPQASANLVAYRAAHPLPDAKPNA
jgi:hypothetical protein